MSYVHLCVQGKKLFFITNNASKSRDAYVKKMTSLGLEAKPVRFHSASRGFVPDCTMAVLAQSAFHF
jgi:ribonucleotide monophosphatase NagD (HAD superfamily)